MAPPIGVQRKFRSPWVCRTAKQDTGSADIMMVSYSPYLNIVECTPKAILVLKVAVLSLAFTRKPSRLSNERQKEPIEVY